MENNRKKYLQVFEYLREFSKLRSKAVRDIENSKNYPEILWFSDIPINKKIDCVTHIDFSNEGDYFLKVSKPKEPLEPMFPECPISIDKWIDKDSLLNREGKPKLFSEIEFEDEVLRLDDFPDVQIYFDEYCNGKWLVDSKEYWTDKVVYDKKYKIYENVNSVYKRLFSIYNKSQQLGEEYELIVAVGLMFFKESEQTHLIRRHLITVKAEIDFEFTHRDSTLIISQSPESRLAIETDAVMDLVDQFNSNDIVASENKAKEIIKEKELVCPFDNGIHEVLQLISERIKPGDGSYNESSRKESKIPKKETVFYSPALILRKRDTKSFTAVYENIIEEIKRSELPDIKSLNDLIGIDVFGEDSVENDDAKGKIFKNDVIYFPKKFNEEQVEIIKKSRQNDKVLVQGPPGTGKSHTIANLICHLLANGQKVLVTAYTKRALEVLKEKLPNEFRNLTVNLLGGDSSSLKDLEASVNSISDELSNTSVDSLKKEIASLEKELANIKEKIAVSTYDLVKVKEKSSRSISINPEYKGTLTELAEKLVADKKDHEWYEDSFVDFEKEEIFEELFSFIECYEYYSGIDESLFQFKLPNAKKLLDEEAFNGFIEVSEKVIKENLSHESCNLIETDDFDLLKKSLQDLLNISNIVNDIYLNSKNEIIKDVLNKNVYPWINKVNRTSFLLDDIKAYDLQSKDRDIEVEYPGHRTLKSLKNDVNILVEYLKKGNSLSGFGFKVKKAFLPAQIKERLYFIDNVFVNGSPCDTIEEFKIVLEDLLIKQTFAELMDVWGDDKEIFKSYVQQVDFYKERCSNTNLLVENITQAVDKIRIIEEISNISINKIDIEELKNLFIDIENTISLDRYSKYQSKIKRVEDYLSGKRIHPIGKELLKTIVDLDLKEYKNKLLQIDEIKEEYKRFNDYKNTSKELRCIFPHLFVKIKDKQFSQNDISKLKQAIFYRNAFAEVKRLLSSDIETKLKTKLKYYESKVDKRIALISAKKSWVYVLDKLNKNKGLRRHLEAWVQAIKKIGKTGRGKRALKFRKIAQQEMEYCKSSVPCWIMPLYKVTETIVPEYGMYDYVIVDEASQLGPDAIFLLYIAKSVIIVGDDKQTSPEYIGVSADVMSPYIKRYLNDIPFRDFYGTEYSFFDHAKRFCDGVIVLREHFRCMPEIIEFSNKLFYAPDGKGLYPLKQYSENRLEPLQHYHCENGYVDGKSSNIQNEPEARAIVNKINELVNDSRYSDKSLGVICLQGNAQSELIESLLVKQIGEKEFNKRKIICGNSSSFQGDERDIIFLSLVTAHNHNRSALTRPEDERRFNVAVSRAIEQIWLFHSILPEDLSNTIDLRYKILDHFINYKHSKPPVPIKIERTLGNQPEPFDSWFEVDIYNDIVSKGHSVVPQYEVAKGRYRIDMVAFLPDGTKIAIECDGDKWHGAERYQDDLMRQKVLERCGWQFFRVRGGEYYSNREKALEPLWKLFTEHECKKIPEENLTKRQYIDVNENVEKYVQDIFEEDIILPINEEVQNKEEESSNNSISEDVNIGAVKVVSDIQESIASVSIDKEEEKVSVQKNIVNEESCEFRKELVEEIEGIKIARYSPKSIVVFGKTKEIKDELKELDGRFNPYLKWDDSRILGWIFPPEKFDEIVNKVREIKEYCKEIK